MKKLSLGILVVVIAVLAISGVVRAMMLIPVADEAKERAKTPEKSPVINETTDGNWELERVDFIHYAKPDHPGKPPKEPKAPKCYKLLGLKWKSLPVDYVINSTNPDDLLEDFVTGAISISAETWDGATGSELFKDTYTTSTDVSYGSQDFVNAISFGDYDDTGMCLTPEPCVIAVTSVWYTPRGRQIVEFDIMFDTDFTWGDAGPTDETELDDLDVMDLQNIATHELGHGVGLGDIYESACSDVTMYGYSKYGETKRRTLEQPDIIGLQTLYGI